MLCAVIMLAAFPHNLLLAQTSASILIDDAKVEVGDEVSMSISLESNPGIAYLKLKISYSDDLEIVSVQNGGVLEGTFTTSRNTSDNPYTCQWTNASDSTGSGELAVITFKTADSAKTGSKDITVEVCECYNQNLDEVSITGDTAKISVSGGSSASGESQSDSSESQNAQDETQSNSKETQSNSKETQSNSKETQSNSKETQNTSDETQSDSGESQIASDESQGTSGESQAEDSQNQNETKSAIGQSGSDAGDSGVVLSLAAALAVCGTFILLIRNTKLLKR